MPLDDASREAADLFARLTGRQVVPRRPAGEFPPDLAVVVGLAAALDDDLAGRLLALRRRSAVGIVVGRTPAELRAKVIATAVAATVAPATLPQRIACQPDWPVGHLDEGLLQIFGATAPREALVAALGRGATLVTLAGHGDGIDGELAGGLVLCPEDEAFAAFDAPEKPACRISGACYRQAAPIGSAAFRRATLHPRTIATRALVWNSCVGWPARHGFIDRNYGAGLRLAASPTIGALLTTDRVAICPRGVTEPLIAALMRGVPLGEAVAGHNASAPARRYGHRLLLFGDPQTRVAPALPAVVSAEEPIESSSAGSEDDRRLAGLVARLTAHPADIADSSAAWTALLQELRSDSLEGLWARTAIAIDPAPAEGPCPYCGLATIDHGLVLAGGERRVVRVCPRCEVISDLPGTPSFCVWISRDGARLDGDFPAGGWRGALIERTRAPFEPGVTPWPPGRDGKPLPLLRLASADTIPVMASAVFHAGGTLSVFARALPATSGRR